MEGVVPLDSPLILVVDDDRASRDIVRLSLERHGYRVVEAEDGAQALDAFERLQPDLVLLDIMMPGMDGIEACTRLRALSAAEPTPILMTTSLSDEGSIERAFDAGATDYIVKPIRMSALTHRIGRLLQARSAAGEVESLARFPAENPNPVLRIARDGTVLYANDAGQHLLHAWSCQDSQPSPFCQDVAANALDLNVVQQIEVEIGDRTLQISVTPVEGKGYANVYAQDVTERKLAEAALKEHAERLEEIVAERTRELREAQAQLLEQQRLQQEIELAVRVQDSLLPRSIPAFDGFEFAAHALPARYVSGDLYDFAAPDPETCFIIVADIAGKGIPAALLSSTARTLLRAETEHELSPATILTNVNRSFYGDLSHAEMFITFAAARLDVNEGTLTYANAGHTELLWWQHARRSCRRLPATGLPIGIFQDLEITEEALLLRPGDLVVLYSDGITEANDTSGAFFGLERLVDLVQTHASLSAGDLCRTIIDAVESFAGGLPRSDDLTLIILKALPRTIEFSFPGRMENLNETILLVRRAVAAYGEDFAYEVVLAASEIITNIIKYACEPESDTVHGELTLELDQVQLDLYDTGEPFDLSSAPPPKLGAPEEGGYGLYVVQQLVDELACSPTSGGNHWRLVKQAADPEG